MAVFFISCPLNYENQLAEEIQSFWFEMMDLDGLPTREPFPELKIEHGGIEIKCPDHLGYQINFFSKIAHRILIRIHQFESRFYDQFEREMKAIPLKKWLAPCPISIKIETVKSRLNHERNLLEVCDKTLPPLGFVPVHAEDAQQKLFIRIVKDKTTISLDTSGEHLHRRGYAVYRGEAPLRENLAALVYAVAVQNGFNSKHQYLFDPFVGSGTLLFEGASFKSANLKRTYAWLDFLNKPKMFNSQTWSKNFRWLLEKKQTTCLGVDLDEKAISNCEKNKNLFQEIYPDIDLSLNLYQADSLKITSEIFPAQKQGWIISNPPYGMRLQNTSAVEVFEHIENLADFKGAVILHPESMKIKFKTLKLKSETDFSNQGLNIKLSVFLKP